MDLRGKVGIVTGGASGIGLATVERLTAEGMRICVVDLDADRAASVASEFGGTSFAADVGASSEVDASFAHCIESLGGVDVAFLNAGIAIGVADLTTLSDELYHRIMRVNVDGVVFGLRAAIKAMSATGGAIVATASLAGLIPFPPDPIYDSTKHAVVGLIRSVAPTVAPQGITVNAVNPGMTDTNILSDAAKLLFAEAEFPLMPASQIADAVVHAVTSGGTGQCFVCQPGRDPIAYGFRDVPGPRTESGAIPIPPGITEGHERLEGWANP